MLCSLFVGGYFILLRSDMIILYDEIAHGPIDVTLVNHVDIFFRYHIAEIPIPPAMVFLSIHNVS